MGRISKRRIDPEIEERIFEIFWSHLSSFNTSKETKDFFMSLLSYTEQVMLSKRLTIAVLLAKNKTYDEISDIIKVSKSTIGSVHKQIFIGAPGYLNAVAKILKDERHEKMWNKLEKLSLEFSLPKRYESEAWKRKSGKGKKLTKRKRQLSV